MSFKENSLSQVNVVVGVARSLPRLSLAKSRRGARDLGRVGAEERDGSGCASLLSSLFRRLC